jgi:hypothetical protein
VTTGIEARWIDSHGYENDAFAVPELGTRVSLNLNNVGSHLVVKHTAYFPDLCGSDSPCRYSYTAAPK